MIPIHGLDIVEAAAGLYKHFTEMCGFGDEQSVYMTYCLLQKAYGLTGDEVLAEINRICDERDKQNGRKEPDNVHP